MSNKYINDAIKQASSINDPAAAHILLVLANRADQHGGCFPSHALIAEETGRSVATVKRKLELLKQQGRLQWKTGRGRNGKNRYRIIAQALSYFAGRENSSSSTEQAPKIAHPVTENSSPVSYEPKENPQKKENPHSLAPSALDDAPPLHMNGFGKEAKQEKSGRPMKEGSSKASKASKQPSPEEAEAFEEFFAVYPRRVGRLAAAKAWKKALKEASAAQIIDGARRYAVEREDANQQYTKFPTTWLSGGCWLDEPGANAPGHEKTYAEMAEELRNGGGLEEAAANGYDGFADLDLAPEEWMADEPVSSVPAAGCVMAAVGHAVGRSSAAGVGTHARIVTSLAEAEAVRWAMREQQRQAVLAVSQQRGP